MSRFLLGFFALWVTILQAQTAGEITGEIRDSAGAAVPGAAVTVTNRDTNLVRSTISTGVGVYSFPALQPGFYSVRVEVRGFSTAVRSDIEVQVQQTVRADFAMQIGEVSQTIEVKAAASLLNTEDSTIGTVIENKRIVDLPLNGRNFLQLVSLAPNVTSGYSPINIGGSRQGGQRVTQNIAVAGQRGTFNRYTLDGVENTDVNFLTYIFLPSIDALQEFKVQTGIYPAEFGRSATQINVSTKPGGNQFHGTAFEFLRNSTLDAKNYAFTSLAPPKDPFRFNQYGFTLGGPVVIPKLFNGRNRLFFMSNYEAFRSRKQGQAVYSVPLPAARDGNIAAVSSNVIYDPATRTGTPGAITATPFPGNVVPRQRFDPSSVKLFEFVPLPNLSLTRSSSNFQTGLRTLTDRDQFNQRIDLAESSKSSWFGRYSWSDEQEVQAGAAQNGSKVLTLVKQVVVSNTRVFTPNLLNEFRFGYSTFLNNLGTQLAFQRNVVDELGITGLTAPTPSAWGIPVVQMSGFNDWGNSSGGPYLNDNQRYQWIDNVAWTRGAHTFRFGVEFLNDHFNQLGNDFVRGAFAFDSTATQNPAQTAGSGYSVADFLLGYNRNAQQALALADVKFRALSKYMYVDDTWKIRPRLTLSLGLRYENTPPYRDANGTAISVDMPYNDTATNITDLNRHPTLVRVGKGDFYENTLLRFNPAIKTARDGRLGDRLIKGDNNDFAPRVGIAWSPHDRWSVRSGFGVFYSQDQGNAVFDIGRNLAGRRNETTDPNFPDLTFRKPFRGAGTTLQINNPTVFANGYDRRTPYTMEYVLNVERELSNSTMLEVGYIGSQSRKLQQLFQLNSAPPSPIGAPQSRRPYQELAVVQQLLSVGRGNYNALSFKLQRRFSKGLTYLMSYTYSRSRDTGSGTRAPALDTTNPNNNYDLNSEWAPSGFDMPHRFVVSPLYELPFMKGNRWVGGWQIGSILTMQAGYPINIRVGSDQSNTGNYSDRPNATGQPSNLSSDVRTPNRWFNTAAYAIQPFGTLGNAGRNTVKAPGLFSWDFSTQKNFRIAERHSMQFRFEAFNIPNHPNWGDPQNLANAVDFGIIRSTRTDMRQLQFALKYIF